MPPNIPDDKSTLVQVTAGSVRQQAIIWVNVDTDLCRHMALLCHNELTILNTFPLITHSIWPTGSRQVSGHSWHKQCVMVYCALFCCRCALSADPYGIRYFVVMHRERLRLRDWDKFIQHNMTLYRCMISDIHDSSYVLFRTNLISNTSLHVGRPLLRPCLVAYAEATLARQKDSATNEKCWHHFRILIVDKWSVVWNECKKSWVPNDRLEKPLIPCNMISN